MRRITIGLALMLATGVAGAAAQGGPASLLDRLPRVATGGYAAALAQARARGPEGRADVLWVELFYGDAAAQAEAEAALRQVPAPAAAAGAAERADASEMAFLRFFAAYIQGQDRSLQAAALRLTEAAPNDVATELAVRTLSGQIENQGQTLLNAVPHLEQALEQPLADPATIYMLGRSLLAAVDAPGLALTQERAMALSGRLAHWQLWGPFGDWANLGFDRTFPIETGMAASYPSELGAGASGPATRSGHAYENTGDGIDFPLDWGAQGVDYAVTYVHAAATTQVLLRLYAPASAQIAINGTVIVRNDRRSSYTPATVVATVTLAAGWNRVVVKLAGEASRNFALMLRPVAGAKVTLQDAGALPTGEHLAGAPQLEHQPVTLGSWSAGQLARHSDDVLALWVDGLRRVQDEDTEHARVALQKAGALDPQAAAVWLDLAEAYGQLTDASQSWASSQIETAAKKAIAVSPTAWRAYDRLGHVLEAEGKPTPAAEQYAHCTNKGYADCDWSAFQLAATQRWIPEAETALGHALADSGSDWSGIGSGLEFYSSIGDAAKLAEWERVLAADPRAAGTLGAYELRHGQAAAAAVHFHTAVENHPSSAGIRQQYLEALLQAGDVTRAYAESQTALRAFPDNRRMAAEADKIALRHNIAQGVTALQNTSYGRDALRLQADYITGQHFWAPWYHAAADVLKDAPGKDAYPNASSILVLDQMVTRINPDSTQDQYIHQIYRVLNATGIQQWGDVTTIPQGADLITVRTIKEDGRMVLPERFTNITSITMSGLEAGDYIEIEFVQHMAASPVVAGTMDNNSFFIFNSNVQPFHYSDYIVLSPPGYPLLTTEERFPNPSKVTTMPDGYMAQEWLVQKTRILISEPMMPNYDTLVPKVWVSSKITWPEMQQYFADHLYAASRATPEMEQEAAKLTAGKTSDVERANALFAWVNASIQPGNGGAFAPARQFFTDRSGNRVATFLGMLAAAHVPYALDLARMSTDNSPTTVPSVFAFSYPLVHVGASSGDDATGWYDLNNDFAKLGYITASVRGGMALEANARPGEASPFVTVPRFDSPLDGVVVNATGSVAESGDATMQFQMEFRGPTGQALREELANVPDANLPQIYQQLLLTSYPNGVASGGTIENREDKTKPLIINVNATVADFVHSEGGTWDIQHFVAGVNMLRRYAPLEFRQQPLLIASDSYEQTNVTITLPEKFGAPQLPQAVKIENNFGSFASSFSFAGQQLTLQRTLALHANRIAPMSYPGFRKFGEAVDGEDRLELTGAVH